MEGLKPGKYRVTARAFTKDLIQSEPLSFEFSIAKLPFPGLDCACDPARADPSCAALGLSKENASDEQARRSWPLTVNWQTRD